MATPSFTTTRAWPTNTARHPNAALYINTGYDPIYTQVDGKHTTVECLTQSATIATSRGATRPSSWWLDVETSNSWSSTDLSLNQYTIQGIVDTVLRQSQPVSGVLANWVATGSSSAGGARS